MTCIAVGAMFSLAVFLQPITGSTGWSHTAVSSAMTLNFLAMGAAGFGWGALSDRIGPRNVVLAGAVLLGLGLYLASRAQSALQFQLAFGLLVGIAVGSFFAPMIAAVMGWITQHRGLAVSLVSVGVGVAPMTMSPFAAWLITQMDWRSAQLVLAVLVWAMLVPAALFVRRPPAVPAAQEQGAAGGPPMSLRDAFVSAPFIVLALTFFACCAAHAGPIFHTITYAMTCGLAPLAAVTIYSVEGLAGLGGGATDAAAVLRGLNKLWELGLSNDALTPIAASLGSDVPFFLEEGTAYATGRGEKLVALPDQGAIPLVLVLPEERVMTPDAYRLLRAGRDEGRLPEGVAVGLERCAAAAKGSLLDDPAFLVNDLEAPVFGKLPGLARLLESEGNDEAGDADGFRDATVRFRNAWLALVPNVRLVNADATDQRTV